MKTREQAEARAMELFPDLPITMENMHTSDNFAKREGFIKCWDEMQQEYAKQSKQGFEKFTMYDDTQTVATTDTVLEQCRQEKMKIAMSEPCEPKDYIIELQPQEKVEKGVEKKRAIAFKHGEVEEIEGKLYTILTIDQAFNAMIEFENTLQDNGLREAAEKVVECFYNEDLRDGRTMMQMINELKKHLNDNKKLNSSTA